MTSDRTQSAGGQSATTPLKVAPSKGEPISGGTTAFQGFDDADFDVFSVPGLEDRMVALKAHLRPKLEQLGQDFADRLSGWTNHTFYPHVAKHARRTVNPPNDSWVAFCEDKRGYKKHPHFQIGAWRTHAFALFGVIYESPVRVRYAERIDQRTEEIIHLIPKDFVWVPNHMDPNAIHASEVGPDELRELTKKLRGKRQGELLVGVTVPREEAVAMPAKTFVDRVASCFHTLLPLYYLAAEEEAAEEEAAEELEVRQH